MTLGAFAARDQLPPSPQRNVTAQPAWPVALSHLVTAYAAQQRGDRDAVVTSLCNAGLLQEPLEPNGAEHASKEADRRQRRDDGDDPPPEAMPDIGRLVVEALESAERSELRFDELFGNAATAALPGAHFATFAGLAPAARPAWILKLLCCALGFRRNHFGRYFAPAPGPLLGEDPLLKLSEQMNEAFETPAGDSNVPAGFTFFGQFVDHDITLDATTRLTDEAVQATAILNQRNPALDLDNVYGGGPDASPELYDAKRGHGILLVGPDGADLARNHKDVAIIGDPRNDENTIVSQLHLHMLHFHNAVLRMIRNTPVDALWGRSDNAEPPDPQGDFDFARRMVRWHYQWALINDWLPRIVEPTPLQAAHAITGVAQGAAAAALPPGYESARDFFQGQTLINCCGEERCRPLMPVEFSAAAFRFAHSQVRSRYDVNDDRLAVPLFVPRPPGLASFRPVPNTDVVDWRRYFELQPGFAPQSARSIDTWLPAQVFQLPFAPGDPNLALRNLVRGTRVYALPSGATVAGNLGVPLNLSAAGKAKLAAAGIAEADAPLWFAILAEADFHGGQLGPVGGLLVAVTLMRLLRCDERAYVHSSGWQPVLVPSDPGTFTVADLLRIGINERQDAFPG
jgi:hypothetical protein